MGKDWWETQIESYMVHLKRNTTIEGKFADSRPKSDVEIKLSIAWLIW